jgi:hypothetical protein
MTLPPTVSRPPPRRRRRRRQIGLWELTIDPLPGDAASEATPGESFGQPHSSRRCGTTAKRTGIGLSQSR